MNKTAIIPLEAGHYYHIYNRGNNHERLFYSKANYEFFLKRYSRTIAPYVETLAYCLLPDHFHLLIKVKSSTSSNRLSEQFRKFFIAYSMAINKQQQRSGSLFQKNFRRKNITDLPYLREVVRYIHSNPLHHNVHPDLQSYPWSSYTCYLNHIRSFLNFSELTAIFGGADEFFRFHQFNIHTPAVLQKTTRPAENEFECSA